MIVPMSWGRKWHGGLLQTTDLDSGALMVERGSNETQILTRKHATRPAAIAKPNCVL